MLKRHTAATIATRLRRRPPVRGTATRSYYPLKTLQRRCCRPSCRSSRGSTTAASRCQPHQGARQHKKSFCGASDGCMAEDPAARVPVRERRAEKDGRSETGLNRRPGDFVLQRAPSTVWPRGRPHAHPVRREAAARRGVARGARRRRERDPAARGHRPRHGGGLQPQGDLDLRRPRREAHRPEGRHHRRRRHQPAPAGLDQRRRRGGPGGAHRAGPGRRPGYLHDRISAAHYRSVDWQRAPAGIRVRAVP
jgi:hypothetical protein